jgi:hypothetical protein
METPFSRSVGLPGAQAVPARVPGRMCHARITAMSTDVSVEIRFGGGAGEKTVTEPFPGNGQRLR